jgi:hypothetical protein
MQPLQLQQKQGFAAQVAAHLRTAAAATAMAVAAL